jgi:hypothetical protein
MERDGKRDGGGGSVQSSVYKSVHENNLLVQGLGNAAAAEGVWVGLLVTTAAVVAVVVGVKRVVVISAIIAIVYGIAVVVVSFIAVISFEGAANVTYLHQRRHLLLLLLPQWLR